MCVMCTHTHTHIEREGEREMDYVLCNIGHKII